MLQSEVATPIVILVVEDDADQAMVLRYYLRNHGYEVEWRNTPQAAFRTALERPIGLIILDVMLNAEEDGYDLCRRFRQEDRLKEIPIIMVTGRADVSDRVHGLRSGADDYIIKPFNPEELLARVQAVLARKAKYEFDERYRTLLENSDDMVFFLTLAGEVEQTNHRAMAYLPASMRSRPHWALAELFDEKFAATLPGLYQRVAAGFDVSGNSWRLAHPHGGVEIVDVRLLPLSQNGRLVGMGCILRDATPREKTIQTIAAQAQDLRHRIEESSARLNQVQQELVMAEKMAALGQLAAGIAHELRNPLNIVSTSIYYLKRILPLENPKAQEHFDIIEEEIGRSLRIINNLLDFARKSNSEREETDINKVLEQTLMLVKKELATKDILVRTDLAYLPRIMANPDDLKQVFLNLILNAEEAMPHGGKLSIRTAMTEVGEVIIEFADTGIGIDESIRERIFEPFFSARKNGQGTGLGLSIVHAAIQRHQGSIHFTSTPAKGTVFTIRLPAAREKYQEQIAASEPG